MEEKIQWAEEILSADPGSKVFFPLAKLYLQNSLTDKAIQTLRTGLERHPEHLEARLLMVKLLHQEEKFDEAFDFLQNMVSILENYPEFWFAWSELLDRKGQSGTAAATEFLAQYFNGQSVDWSEIIHSGLKYIKDKSSRPKKGPQDSADGSFTDESRMFAADIGSQDESKDESEPGQYEPNSEEFQSYRTKTMADILASQGNFAKALEIYSELLQETKSAERQKELQDCIDLMQSKLQTNDTSAAEDTAEKGAKKESKDNLLKQLDRLANRLESRKS